MRSVLVLSLCCISLLCLQLHALPGRNRLDFKTILNQLEEANTGVPDSNPYSHDSTTAPAVRLDKTTLLRVLLFKTPPPSSQESMSDPIPTATSVEQVSESNQKNPRGRRSAHARGHHHQHGQLMRVGCVLGTCQVQKLSHRLYQLVGQKGREDAAPADLHNPHSYG